MNSTIEQPTIPDYLAEETRILLDKFGKGSHKPGSGSAAAFSGMISAKLLLTVISLTIDEKRKEKYQSNWPRLIEISEDVKNIIFPKLCELFQEDCEAFSLVVKERERRDATSDELEKAIIQRSIDSYMVDAISIPFEIANICTELAKYSLEVFDLGWKAVRGDSGVAIENALAAIGGSTFVITLNLSHISTLNEFSANSRVELQRIESEFGKLKKALEVRHQTLRDELYSRVDIQDSIYSIKENISSQELNNYDYIQRIVRDVQLALSKNHNIGSESTLKQKIKILNARKVLAHLGYKVAYSNKVGSAYVSKKYKEIAGVCDNKNQLVAISKLYEKEIQRFTLAHELGHALLHSEETMFRDIPLDGADNQVRDIIEIQANKFAAFFLMPSKLVTDEFYRRFGLSAITSDIYKSSMNFSPQSQIKLRKISRHFASLVQEESKDSIAKLFGVSHEAMAIRLEELQLVVQ